MKSFLEAQDPARPLLILSNDRAASEEIARFRPNTLGWYRLSWTQFLERLAGKRCLSRMARWAVMQRTLEEAPLQDYRELVSFPGFAVCLERTVRELRLFGVDPGGELGRISARFGEGLGTLADEADLVRLASERLPSDDWVRSLQAVLVADLVLESPAEERLLRQLLEIVPRSQVASWSREAVAPRVLSAADESLECQELARQLWDGARQGFAWDEMAILLRQPERYRWCLESLLARSEIPAFFSRAAQRPHPAGRGLLALLYCARDGLCARRFAEYLSIGEIPLEIYRGEDIREEEPERRELPVPYRWEELLGTASVIRGPERWERRLKGLAEQRKQQIAQLLRDDPDSPRLAQYQEDIRLLGSLESFALPLLRYLAQMSAPRSWGGWLSCLEELARRALAYPEPVLELLRELEPVAGIEEVPLDQVISTLSSPLCQTLSPCRGHRYGQVFVGSLEEARARSFELVLLPGMAERRFPPVLRGDPLLGDKKRHSLGLPTLEERARREREMFQRACSAARSRLVVSYPRSDGETGRPLLPSSYLLELAQSSSFRQLIEQAAEAGEMAASWPAPRDPMRAIDWGEHSLSWMRRLTSKGSAHFMFEHSPFLAQALRSRFRRDQSQKWTSADGCHGIPGAEAFLPSRRAYSPSTLEKFASCPYRFWLHSVYGLAPREVPEALEEMDPLTRGSFVHDVHAALVWRANGARVDRPTLLGWLRQECARVAAEYADTQFPLVPRLFEDEVRQLERELAEWLSKREPDWVPIHAELAFQLPDDLKRDPASSPSAAELGRGYRLRGSIDRVERKGGKLRVVDLKTGRPKSLYGFTLGRGEALQPVLYSLAVQNFLGLPVERASLEYATLRGRFSAAVLTRIEQATEVALEALDRLEAALSAGHLPAYPNHWGCKYCDYTGVCGRKVKSVSGPVTAAVDWWRDQP